MYKDLLNKKVVIRSGDAGVYFGTLTKVEGDSVRLENVRNIWYWKGANSLTDIALYGIQSGHITPAIGSMVIIRVCQILSLSDEAILNLESQPVWSAR